jgi:hypothetical protein
MSARKIKVAREIFEEVSRVQSRFRLNWDVEPVGAKETDWTEAVLASGYEQELMSFILPEKWFASAAEKLPDTLQSALIAGKVKLGRWGRRSQETIPAFPALLLPTDCEDALMAGVMRHFGKLAFPGVHSVLAAGSQIFSERVCSENEIGRRLDQAIQFLARNKLVPEPKGMTLRLAASAALAAAFAEAASGKRFRAPSLQLGVSDGLVAVSVKWVASSQGVQPWLRPKLPLKIAVAYSDGFWMHLLPESKEVEAVMLYGLETRSAEKGLASLHLGVDVLTNERVLAVKDGSESGTMRDQQLVTFNEMPAPTDLEEAQDIEAEKENKTDNVTISRQAEVIGDGRFVVKASARNVSESQAPIRIAASEPVVEPTTHNYKEQYTSLVKKLTEVMESEKAAKKELRSLQHQMANRSSAGEAGLKTEVQALKQKLEAAKAKEMDLIKKLTVSVDRLKQYQAAMKSGGKKAAG